MRRYVVCLALMVAAPAWAQEGEAVEVPRAQKLPLDDLLSDAPPPNLPAAAPHNLPKPPPQAAPAAVKAPEGPSLSALTQAAAVVEGPRPAPPQADFTDQPEPPPEARPADVGARAAFAHGVVIGREASRLTLMGERGFVHSWEMPERLHLVSLADGQLAERSAVNSGDFLALVGQEEGTGLPIVAYLKLGEQPQGKYADMAESIEGCYAHAVKALEAQSSPQ